MINRAVGWCKGFESIVNQSNKTFPLILTVIFDPIRIDAACSHSLLLGSVCERKSTLFQGILLRMVVRYDGSRLIEGNVNTLAETGSS